MNPITIHIGAGKCGSSAIQAALTRRPTFGSGDGRTFNYVAIRKDGRVDWGKDLRVPKRHVYRKSVRFDALDELPDAGIADLRARLAAIENPIVSNEGLLVASAGARRCLARIGLPVRVIAYVRPPVEYLNSAWWQWGAWSAEPRDGWIDDRIERATWSRWLEGWRSIDEVEDLSVRLLPQDVVADFLSRLGHTAPPPRTAPRINPSLPAVLLRLLQRHPGLMRDHERAINFKLLGLLPGSPFEKAPWVIDQPLAAKIIERTFASNQRLLEMISPSDGEAMRADPRWWDAAAYAGLEAEPFEPSPTDEPELDDLAARLIDALLTSRGKDARRPPRKA